MLRVDAPSPVARRILAAGGAVALAAGVHSAVAGVRSVPGHRGAAAPTLESELRFYGVFYAAYGAGMLEAARRGPTSRDLPVAAGTLFAAGVARAHGWRAAGRPSREQLALLAIELVGPPLALGLTRRGTAQDPSKPS